MKTLLLSLILAIAILKCVSAKWCANDYQCIASSQRKWKNGHWVRYQCEKDPNGIDGKCKFKLFANNNNVLATLNELDRENYDNDSFSGSAVLICLLSGFTAGAYGAWYFTKNKEYSRF